MGVLKLRRAAGLALHETDLRVRLREKGPELVDAVQAPPRVGRFVRVRDVRMDVPTLDRIRTPFSDEYPEKFLRVRHGADRRDHHLRARLDGMDRLGRLDDHFEVVLHLLAERLVPDLPLVHDVAVAPDDFAAVPQPRLESLRIPDHARNARSDVAAGLVDRIAVGEADPRLDADRRGMPNLNIEPREVVLPLFLLGLRPAAEEPRVLRPRLAEIFCVGLEVGEFAVEAFASDRPPRRRNLRRFACPEKSDLPESRIGPQKSLHRDASPVADQVRVHVVPRRERNGAQKRRPCNKDGSCHALHAHSFQLPQAKPPF